MTGENNKNEENKNKFLMNILLFFPCVIGKIFLKIFWIIPPKTQGKEETSNYKKIYLTGFKFFLIFYSYFLFLFIFVKLFENNSFFFKIMYYNFTAFLFSTCLHTILFFILRFITQKQNLKKIYNNIASDEQIIHIIKHKEISTIAYILYISFASSIAMRCIAEIETDPISYVFGYLMLCLYPRLLIDFTNTNVITNKRILTERFLTCLLPISYTFEELERIKQRNLSLKRTDYIGLNLVKQDILLSDAISVNTEQFGVMNLVVLNMKNGLRLVFNEDNNITAKNKIEKSIRGIK